MPKSHGRSHNHSYLRRSEYDSGFGGKGQTIQKQEQVLPWDCCAISLQPFEDPVCTSDGTMFDMSNLLAWLKAHAVHPITGEKMIAKDIIVLHMHKNSDGRWHCPVMLKQFTESSHIVAIKTSGQVYSYEAIQTLNIQRKDWKDPTTGIAFEKSDIIHLHDPSTGVSKKTAQFYHIKNQISMDGTPSDPLSQKMNLNAVTADVIRATKSSSTSNPQKHLSTTSSSNLKDQSSSSPVTAAQSSVSSFTATNVKYAPEAPVAVIEQKTKRKGRVQLVTSLGTLDITLHTDLCPKTCENFLTLVERGYYDGTIFHRSIKNFMIQGGDPEGTGKGGQSCWGKPFEDEIVPSLKHEARGVLSMANRGPGTNGSQFFILFKSAHHLDGKHTVFGRLSSESMSVLKEMEAVPTSALDVPIDPIKIIKAGVISNPLDEYALQMERKAAAEAEKKKQEALKDRSERGLWYSNPSTIPTSSSSSSSGSSSSIGKYMTASKDHATSSPKNTDVMDKSNEKKRSMAFTPSSLGTSKKHKSNDGDWSIF